MWGGLIDLIPQTEFGFYILFKSPDFHTFHPIKKDDYASLSTSGATSSAVLQLKRVPSQRRPPEKF